MLEQTELTVEATKELLMSSDLRFRQVPGWGTKADIKIDDKWLHLCRTDLKDDIRTSSAEGESSVEEVRKKYLQKIRYGARICDEHGYFAVIDSYSDG